MVGKEIELNLGSKMSSLTPDLQLHLPVLTCVLSNMAEKIQWGNLYTQKFNTYKFNIHQYTIILTSTLFDFMGDRMGNACWRSDSRNLSLWKPCSIRLHYVVVEISLLEFSAMLLETKVKTDKMP